MGYFKSPLTGITTAGRPIFYLILLQNTKNILLNLYAKEYLGEMQRTELEEIFFCNKAR